jgi:hypothetical protein
LRKFVSILILSLFLYNNFGFLAVHPLLSIYYKYLGMQRVEMPSEGELIELIIFNKEDIQKKKINFKWIHSREFKYNGDMYDIVEKKETETELIIHCINDTKEKILEEEFEKKVQKNSLENKQRPISNNFNFVSISEPVQIEYPVDVIVSGSTFKNWINNFYSSPNLDIASPPPRLV